MINVCVMGTIDKGNLANDSKRLTMNARNRKNIFSSFLLSFYGFTISVVGVTGSDVSVVK